MNRRLLMVATVTLTLSALGAAAERDTATVTLGEGRRGLLLEVTGDVDEKAGTISIQSAKRLGDVVQMCARPPKK